MSCTGGVGAGGSGDGKDGDTQPAADHAAGPDGLGSEEIADGGETGDVLADVAPSPPVLEVLVPGIPLMPVAADALARAPAWVRPDLAIQMDMLFADQQELLAAQILGVEDGRLVDEVSFLAAHISPEILVDPAFHPQLLEEVAADVHAKDEALDYVTLVDIGVPGEDDDFHTTASYRVETPEGVVEERTIDRDLYYWFVVHPRLEDEWPFYIDGWAQCLAQPAQCPVSPDQGQLWRTFLWDGALEGMAACPGYSTCPLLADYLLGEQVLWRSIHGQVDDNGAVGGVTRFVLDALDFGAMAGERPIQPNRIYAVKWGNCGEHADLTSAAARTGLIPARNVGAHTNDHTWDEFFDGAEWLGWEPIGSFIGHKKYYGDNVYAASWTRGDSYVVTDSHTWGEAFDVEVSVRDGAGAALDGARVIIFGAKDDGYWHYVHEAFTDVDGVARASLGRANAYGMRVETPWGEWPGPDSLGGLAEGPVEEDVVAVEVAVEGVRTPIALPAVQAPEAPAALDLHLDIASQSSRTLQAAITSGTTFSRADRAPPLPVFVTDAPGYEAWRAGGDATAVDLRVVQGAEALTVSLPGDRDWVIVVANPGYDHTVAVGTIAISVEGREPGAGSAAWEGLLLLPPGGHQAFRVLPGGA
ncbi:MAG: hypothetical protein FJ098_09290 [Deltaproteobacteria bacterium]|nr:hypothetical protein [Deltaproteobacteria bacterium]